MKHFLTITLLFLLYGCLHQTARGPETSVPESGWVLFDNDDDTAEFKVYYILSSDKGRYRKGWEKLVSTHLTSTWLQLYDCSEEKVRTLQVVNQGADNSTFTFRETDKNGKWHPPLFGPAKILMEKNCQTGSPQ